MTYAAPDCSQVANARRMLDIWRALLIYARPIGRHTAASCPVANLRGLAHWRPLGRPWWPGFDLRGTQAAFALGFWAPWCDPPET